MKPLYISDVANDKLKCRGLRKTQQDCWGGITQFESISVEGDLCQSAAFVLLQGKGIPPPLAQQHRMQPQFWESARLQ